MLKNYTKYVISVFMDTTIPGISFDINGTCNFVTMIKWKGNILQVKPVKKRLEVFYRK